jgi:lipopolysaccharide/colanic/teichoic acid biosynthesis glycosyltransferase
MSSSTNILPLYAPTFAPAADDAAAEPAADGSLAWWKTTFDLTAASLLLVLAAPVLLLAAAAVKLTSAGPAFYSQVRVGANGRRFVLWKLRSMRHNCEAASGIRWATRRDPRVTPVGRFLRASHIDELPQLFNVLRGEMSLVGPRPERPEITAGLAAVVPRYDDRHRVKPGVTGLAQILLPPDTDLDSVRRKVATDLRYVSGFGPWMELRVLVGTALHLVKVPGPTVARLLRLPYPADAA